MPRRPHTPSSLASVEALCAADRIRVRAAAVVSAAGLTLPQFNTLRILRGAGEPLPIMEIRRRLIERTPGITRLIDGLERMKLVTRCPCDTDRRATMCTITDAGLARLGQLDRPMADSDREALAELSKADPLPSPTPCRPRRYWISPSPASGTRCRSTARTWPT